MNPAHHHNHDDDDDNVIVFPTADPAGTVRAITGAAGEIEADTAVSGELLTERESAALDRRLAAQRAGQQTLRAAGAVVRVVSTGVRHERTRQAGRALMRNAGYVVAGSAARRAERRARGKHLDLEQAITTLRVNAKNAEDFATLAGLEETLERRRTGAAQRGRERRVEILKWSGGVVIVLASGHVILLGVAAVQAVIGAGSLTDRWHDIVGFWSTLVEMSPVGGYWWAWALAGATTWAVRCNLIGRGLGTLPVWAAPVESVAAEGRNIIPDESAVLNALRHLTGLPKLREAFKKGWGSTVLPRWIDPPYQDGKGWRMRLVLPEGVPVEEIVKRKSVLAHNLVRLPVEVWPSEPKDKPGVLDLWVANQGALSGPVEAWPLLHEGTADYFKGVPLGMNIRGDVVYGRLAATNYAVAGTMGSGKSTLLITLIAGAMLDPLVDIDVFVLAENADFDPFEPRLRTLRTGANSETVKSCLDTLTALYAELEIRGKALKEHGERAVNRKLAEKDSRLRPRLVVIDECQALFMNESHGEEAANVVQLLISAARKYAITLVFATPEPSTASLPRKVISVTGCKACYAIGDQQSNDAVLGTGSYKAGISAVSLEPMTSEGPGDIGTAMVRGIMAKPGLLRTFYLKKDATVDEVTPVVERALALRDAAGITSRPTSVARATDHLADISVVLAGQTLVGQQEVLGLLAAYKPDIYTGWSPTELREALPDEAKPYKTRNGTMHVHGDRVRDALNHRNTDTDSDDAGEGDQDLTDREALGS